jgi:hypothetical protein
MGGFAVVFLIMLFVALIIMIFKLFGLRNKRIRALIDFLKKQLQYNAWLRYLIVSNLLLTH